ISVSMAMVSTASVSGMATTIALCTNEAVPSLREKTTTKENRYNESGKTQSSGTGVMSVVMKAVTPSIRLEGTNASPIHLRRLKSVGLPTSAPLWAAASCASVSAATAVERCSSASSSSSRTGALGAALAAAAGAERQSTSAQPKTSTTSSAYPTDHSSPWVASLRLGSTTKGYPKSPITLPRLEA